MRNIWGYVVGVVVLAGAIVAVYQAVNDTPSGRSQRTAAPPPVAAAAAGAPKPDASFGKIEVTDEDFVLGKREAPVTVIEYASLTCPHCATLHNDVLPPFKKDYVETGKVRFVYRDFPLDQLALAASQLARCAGRDRFFGFIDVLFAGQAQWARSPDPMRALEQVGRIGGVPPEKFEACRKDEEATAKILQQRLDGTSKFQINSTPTLIVNGDRYSGGLGYDQLKAVIEAHLTKG